MKKGAWSKEEDEKLINYVNNHGFSSWSDVPLNAGLQRCGKSCRLRWMNYLRPSIKRGNFTRKEEDTIIKLQRLLGNRWSAIAAKLPGRTDNEIKNVWNARLKKRVELEQAAQEAGKEPPAPAPAPVNDGFVPAFNGSVAVAGGGGNLGGGFLNLGLEMGPAQYCQCHYHYDHRHAPYVVPHHQPLVLTSPPHPVLTNALKDFGQQLYYADFYSNELKPFGAPIEGSGFPAVADGGSGGGESSGGGFRRADSGGIAFWQDLLIKADNEAPDFRRFY